MTSYSEVWSLHLPERRLGGAAFPKKRCSVCFLWWNTDDFCGSQIWQKVWRITASLLITTDLTSWSFLPSYWTCVLQKDTSPALRLQGRSGCGQETVQGEQASIRRYTSPLLPFLWPPLYLALTPTARPNSSAGNLDGGFHMTLSVRFLPGLGFVRIWRLQSSFWHPSSLGLLILPMVWSLYYELKWIILLFL